MRKFNIVLANSGSDKQNFHAQCFREVVMVLKFGLEDLGFEVVCGNGLQKKCTNLILGYHFLKGKKLPPGYDCIIYQLEELDENGSLPLAVIETLRSPGAIVWDFSEQNIDFLAERGIEAVCKPIGFHPKMLRIQHRKEKDVDVLFYGSRNDRRLKILKELHGKFKLKPLFGVYGDERDHWIERSKIVVSIYYYETKYFDDVRMSYLLNNKVFTIVENTPHKKYEDFVVYADYDKIVETCEFYLQDDLHRNQTTDKSFKEFSQYPESEFLRKALSVSHLSSVPV
ncbi:MAG: hypothetical protein E2O76_05380 [Caldithrix sp.]|nr:MAG: hypothetical protein E2O76_05380 [Caldithrix sp.]